VDFNLQKHSKLQNNVNGGKLVCPHVSSHKMFDVLDKFHVH